MFTILLRVSLLIVMFSSNFAHSSKTYQKNLKKLYTKMAASEVCCSGYRDFEFFSLDDVKRNKVILSHGSHVYPFNEKNSYFSAHMLPKTKYPFIKLDIPIPQLTGLKKSLIDVNVLFLNGRFKALPATEGVWVNQYIKDPYVANRSYFKKKIAIPKRAKYLLVYSQPEFKMDMGLLYNIKIKNVHQLLSAMPIDYRFHSKPIGVLYLSLVHE